MCFRRRLHCSAACRLKRPAELAWRNCWTTSVPAKNSSILRHMRHYGKVCHATCMCEYTACGSCKGAWYWQKGIVRRMYDEGKFVVCRGSAVMHKQLQKVMLCKLHTPSLQRSDATQPCTSCLLICLQTHHRIHTSYIRICIHHRHHASGGDACRTNVLQASSPAVVQSATLSCLVSAPANAMFKATEFD